VLTGIKKTVYDVLYYLFPSYQLSVKTEGMEIVSKMDQGAWKGKCYYFQNFFEENWWKEENLLQDFFGESIFEHLHWEKP